MKSGPSADYPVSVVPESWEVIDSTRTPLYEGIYRVTLNATVDVVFVPDVSAVAPPWSGRRVPENIDDVRTLEEARLMTALVSTYVVTPNDARAGTVERFEFDGDQGTVRYVGETEFAQFSADLDALSRIVGSVAPDRTVSDLRAHAVIRFVEAEVVAQPWFAPADAAWLGRAPSADRP